MATQLEDMIAKELNKCLRSFETAGKGSDGKAQVYTVFAGSVSQLAVRIAAVVSKR